MPAETSPISELLNKGADPHILVLDSGYPPRDVLKACLPVKWFDIQAPETFLKQCLTTAHTVTDITNRKGGDSFKVYCENDDVSQPHLPQDWKTMTVRLWQGGAKPMENISFTIVFNDGVNIYINYVTGPRANDDFTYISLGQMGSGQRVALVTTFAGFVIYPDGGASVNYQKLALSYEWGGLGARTRLQKQASGQSPITLVSLRHNFYETINIAFQGNERVNQIMIPYAVPWPFFLTED